MTLPGAAFKAAALAAGLLAAALLLAACAQVGPPRPPSANLPAAPAQFVLRRSGGELRLRWTSSPRTNDGAAQKGPITPFLCVWPTRHPRLPPPRDVFCPRAAAIAAPAAPGASGVASLPLAQLFPALPAAGGTPPRLALPSVFLALSFANSRGARGDWSAFQAVPTAPAAPPPSGLVAAVRPAPGGVAIHLAWRPVAPVASGFISGLRVFRRALPPFLAAEASGEPENGDWEAQADLPPVATAYSDRHVVVGQTYQYELRSLIGAGANQVEGPASAVVTVAARDVFPPPAPSGLRAALSPGPPVTVELSWLPVTAPDLAGYNVYRRRPPSDGAAGAWVKVNPALLPTPVFSLPLGANAPAWRFAVTAVDQRGNESAPSPPVTVFAPAP